jgi:hypothetical protein
MKEHLEHLKEIRTLMERSSKFLSLSGLSGISAGLIALLGALTVYSKKVSLTGDSSPNGIFQIQNTPEINFKWFVIKIAVAVVILAIGTGYYFTKRKAQAHNLTVWNSLSKKLLIDIATPLITGAIFSLSLVFQNTLWLAASATLVFYGLALVSASKFTVRDVFYLGLLEIILGLLSLLFTGNTFIFWVLGFGVLHILYGTMMYFKYDIRKLQ